MRTKPLRQSEVLSLRRLIGTLAPHAERERDMCRHDDGPATCTRPRGHDGPHVGHVTAIEACAIWDANEEVDL